MSGAPIPANQLRVRPHRIGGPNATLERLDPRERVRHPLEWKRVGHDTAAVDGGRHGHGLDLGSGCDLREQRLLTRMPGEPVPLGRPVVHAAEQQHRRVLPGAVVLDPGGLRSALEVVLARVGLREEALHRLELVRTMEMRRAGDRDLGVVEVGPRAHERERLERLRGAAEKRDERRVAAGRDDVSIGHGDSVHAVPSLLAPASKAHDRDPLHSGSSVDAMFGPGAQ